VQLFILKILCGKERSSLVLKLPMSTFGFFGTSDSHGIKMDDVIVIGAIV